MFILVSATATLTTGKLFQSYLEVGFSFIMKSKQFRELLSN